MFVLEDLKTNKKNVLEKIFTESGRAGVISFCAGVLDKRAYFTVDMKGNIKRKNISYVIPSAVFTENDNAFIDYVAASLDFTEKTKIEKIERMNNIEEVEKNIFKLLAKGDFHFAAKYCKELFMRNSEELFRVLFQFALMDNIAFEKSLAVYSLKKYFEKFGYSDEVLYLTISYLAKMRADFSEYENVQNENINISKENLKEFFKINFEKFKTKKGLELLSYLVGLLSYNYENETKFIAVFKKRAEMYVANKDADNEKLSEITSEIFEYLSKEV